MKLHEVSGDTPDLGLDAAHFDDDEPGAQPQDQRGQPESRRRRREAERSAQIDLEIPLFAESKQFAIAAGIQLFCGSIVFETTFEFYE